MEYRYLRGPPIIYITCLKLRLNGEHRSEILELNFIGKVMLNLAKHLTVITGRFSSTKVTNISKVRPAVAVDFLAVENRQIIV